MTKQEFYIRYANELQPYTDEQKEFFWRMYDEDPLQFDESMIDQQYFN